MKVIYISIIELFSIGFKEDEDDDNKRKSSFMTSYEILHYEYYSE